MLGDKLIFKAKHETNAKKIVKKFLETYKRGNRMIICIGGESGTGKTETGFYVREALYNCGIKSQLVSIDDYYKTRWNERNEQRQKTKIIGHKEMDWDKINDVVSTFHSSWHRMLVLQHINKFTNSLDYMGVENRNLEVVIFEGLYALYITDKYPVFKVYLKGTYKQTKRFRRERNKEPHTEFRQKVLEKEHKEIIKTKLKANLVI